MFEAESVFDGSDLSKLLVRRALNLVFATITVWLILDLNNAASFLDGNFKRRWEGAIVAPEFHATYEGPVPDLSGRIEHGELDGCTAREAVGVSPEGIPRASALSYGRSEPA